jgi:hypothetical protein
MQGAPKRQVNAEDMLAELKRVVDSSGRTPDNSFSSASAPPKLTSNLQNQEIAGSQLGETIGRAIPAKGDAAGRADRRKPTRSRRWDLIASGVALAIAVGMLGSYVVLNGVPGVLEPLVARTEMPPVAESQPVQASQAGAQGVGAQQTGARLTSVETMGSAEAPKASAALPPGRPNQAATPVSTIRIGRNGAPLETAQPAPAATGSAARAADAANTAQTTGRAATPVAPASTVQDPPPSAAEAASEALLPIERDEPDQPPVARTPPLPPEAPNTAASQPFKPEAAPIAATPSSPLSTASAPPSETPKTHAKHAASAPDETVELSAAKSESKKKPAEKPSSLKLRQSVKASSKPAAETARRAAEPAPAKVAETPPAAPANAPAPAAPAPKASVQQRVADGVSHAFGYLVHLPGSLVPHFGGSSPGAQ